MSDWLDELDQLERSDRRNKVSHWGLSSYLRMLHEHGRELIDAMRGWQEAIDTGDAIEDAYWGVREERNNLRAENEKLRALLRLCEWPDMEMRCSMCGGFMPTPANEGLRYRGHTETCELAGVLKPNNLDNSPTEQGKVNSK